MRCRILPFSSVPVAAAIGISGPPDRSISGLGQGPSHRDGDTPAAIVGNEYGINSREPAVGRTGKGFATDSSRDRHAGSQAGQNMRLCGQHRRDGSIPVAIDSFRTPSTRPSVAIPHGDGTHSVHMPPCSSVLAHPPDGYGSIPPRGGHFQSPRRGTGVSLTAVPPGSRFGPVFRTAPYPHPRPGNPIAAQDFPDRRVTGKAEAIVRDALPAAADPPARHTACRIQDHSSIQRHL